MTPLGKLDPSSSQLKMKYGKQTITEQKDRNTAVYVFWDLHTSLLAPDNYNAPLKLKNNIEMAVQNLDSKLKVKEMSVFGDVGLLKEKGLLKGNDFENVFTVIKCLDRLYYCEGHTQPKPKTPDVVMTFQNHLLGHANDRAGGIYLVMSGDFELCPSLDYLREEGNAVILAHPDDSNPVFHDHVHYTYMLKDLANGGMPSYFCDDFSKINPVRF